MAFDFSSRTFTLDLDEVRLLRLLDALPRHEVQLRHQLALVADAQRGVRARVERLELRLQLLVEQDCRCSLARRLEHVRVAESAHEHDAAEALQRDAPAQQVAHIPLFSQPPHTPSSNPPSG